VNLRWDQRWLAVKPQQRKPSPLITDQARAMASKHSAARPPKRWSAEVARRPPALVLEPGVFTWSDPSQIAASLLASAQRSTHRKRSVYASAMAMLCLYINRAGRNLNQAQRQVLEAAKEELRLWPGR
jgi:hypothetical protein